VQIFEDAGLEPPSTLAELYEVAAALQAEGVEPFALGARGTWTIALLVFENLMVALRGPDFYEQYLGGELDNAADPRMLEVLDETLRFWQFVSEDARSIEWDEAVARVHDGKAAMTVMGDWAKGTLKQLGGEPGVTFGQLPFPGTEGVFVFTADTFPLPKGAPEREAALDVLSTFGSLEGQAAFNPLKGSIPARLDADPDGYDQLARRTIQDFQDSRLILALSGLAPAAFTDEVQQALGEMIDTGNPEPARFALMNRYDVLKP
jgi:glucose/mannose transport system substrate-binding protein